MFTPGTYPTEWLEDSSTLDPPKRQAIERLLWDLEGSLEFWKSQQKNTAVMAASRHLRRLGFRISEDIATVQVCEWLIRKLRLRLAVGPAKKAVASKAKASKKVSKGAK